MGGNITLVRAKAVHFYLTLKCAVADTEKEFKGCIFRGNLLRHHAATKNVK